MTNIAVACTGDGQISGHFGRSTHFQIFGVEDGEIRTVTTALVAPVLVGMGEGRRGVQAAGSPVHTNAHPRRQEHHHGHDHLLGALDGCAAVLSGGMGEGVAGSLARNAITPVVVDGGYTPEEAVQAYVDGSLRTGSLHACCGHKDRHDH